MCINQGMRLVTTLAMVMITVMFGALAAPAEEIASGTTLLVAKVSPQAVVSLSSGASYELKYDQIVESEGGTVRLMIEDGDSFRLVTDLRDDKDAALRTEFAKGGVSLLRIECVFP